MLTRPLPLIQLVASAAAGLALYGAFPTVGMWPLASVGVALLVLATGAGSQRPSQRGSARHTVPAAPRAPVLRVVLAGAILGAVAGAVEHWFLVGWTGVYLGWLPRFAVTALMACYLAAAGAGLALTARLPHWASRAVAAAAWWVAIEWVQGVFPFGGFAWSRLAFSQADAPTLGLASLGGAPLVSFAVALAGALLAEAVRAARAHTPTRMPIRASALAAAAALMVTLAGLAVPRPSHPDVGAMRVIGIQGDVPVAGLSFNAQRRAVLDNHAELTQQVAEQVAAGDRQRPDLVVWPENAADIDPFANPDAYRIIAAAVDAVDAPTLVGTLVRQADGRVANTTLLWAPGVGETASQPIDSYVKRLPVPFAEYVPYRELFVQVSSMLEQAGNMVAGSAVGRFSIDGTPVGDLICFEIIDDAAVRETADGAQLMVLQTNNATFGYTAESAQQLAITRLRAVEHGRAFAHISTVGVSALVLPNAALLQPTQLYTPAVLDAELPLRASRTIATRYGAAVETALVVGGMLGVLVSARRRHLSAPRSPRA